MSDVGQHRVVIQRLQYRAYRSGDSTGLNGTGGFPKPNNGYEQLARQDHF